MLNRISKHHDRLNPRHYPLLCLPGRISGLRMAGDVLVILAVNYTKTLHHLENVRKLLLEAKGRTPFDPVPAILELNSAVAEVQQAQDIARSGSKRVSAHPDTVKLEEP